MNIATGERVSTKDGKLNSKRVYVGDLGSNPDITSTVKLTPLTIHPRKFKEFIENNPDEYYSNNVDFVSWFEYDEVFVIGPSGNIKCMTEHPDYHRWKEELNPGEFWSIFGESWVDEILQC